MPPKSRSGIPGPLDNLPRPLDERGRPGRARRRVLRLGAMALAGVGIAAALTILANRPAPVGDVAGIVATPGPSAVAVADPSAVPRPVVTPSSVPSPVPSASAVPIGNVGPPDPATLTGYQWPLPKGRQTLPFGPSSLGSRVVDGKLFHDGLDLATFCGDRVVAAHDGTVLAASRHYDRVVGWIGDLEPYFARLDKKKLWNTLPIMVVIDDGNGYRSLYAHFSKVVVKKGDVVKAGQFIGYEGATGRATGCHVHYGLFSPAETATFGIDPGVAKRMKLPATEIARIDPRLVLPPRTKH